MTILHRHGAPAGRVFPALLTQALEPAGLSVGELARRAWAPAYALGAALGAALLAARLAFDLDSLAPLLLVAGGGLAFYWLAYVTVFLTPTERSLLAGLGGRRVP